MKILVVDDHPLILEALERYVAIAEPRWTLLTARSRDDALRVLALHADCDAVLLDLALPGTRGLAFLVELRRDRPRLPIIVLSATHDRATIDGAIAAGARGYVAKRADAAEVAAAVRSALRGGRPVASASDPRSRPADPWPVGLPIAFTQRQSEVLRLLAQGKPNKLICRDLALSEGTVKVHVSAILKALNVHTRTQAIVELARRGVDVDALRP
ncbi:MAG TPA: response regulator transcription factor [Casimicrobiaceae bacterium]|jgi:DNA-binding NarL/FixJ family response regulator|nr:response regulator transcription factor [Casimicrobiaceae bacterium]